MSDGRSLDYHIRDYNEDMNKYGGDRFIGCPCF